MQNHLVTVSLDRQKEINRNSSVTQLIYLKIINIILITKERVLNNMSYYLLKLPLTRTHSESWWFLLIHLTRTKLSNSFSNDNILQLLHLVSAEQQQNSITSLLGHCRKTLLFHFSNSFTAQTLLTTFNNSLSNSFSLTTFSNSFSLTTFSN